MSTFDPYHKWLAIPPEDQPADYYRLLGVVRFETDPDVIGTAADLRMSFIQQLSNGPHRAESQRILNELAQARICLLDADRRRDYDLRLTSESRATNSTDFEIPPSTMPTKVVAESSRRETSKRTTVPDRKVIGILATVVLLAICITVYTQRPNEHEGPQLPPTLAFPFDSASAAQAQQQWANHLGCSQIVENSLGIQLTVIPPGEFWMGSPETEIGRSANEDRHRVQLTQPILVGIHEITLGQFKQFIEITNYETEAESDYGGHGWDMDNRRMDGPHPQYFWNHTGWEPYTDEHPVVNLTWNDAIAFCNWMSRHEALPQYYDVSHDRNTARILGGDGYRLLTEAEWEYVCRAGTVTTYWHGEDAEGLANVGNIGDGTATEVCGDYTPWPFIRAQDGFAFGAPIGQFRPNPFGLVDTHGNVWEWCWDSYHENAYRERAIVSVDPVVSTSTELRVVRGASFDGGASHARSANRDGLAPSHRDDNIGLRIARTPIRGNVGGLSASPIP